MSDTSIDTLRHNEARLSRAHDQATFLFGSASITCSDPDAPHAQNPSVSECIFVGGGSEFDIYAFTVTYASSATPFTGAGYEEVTKDVCIRVPREGFSESKKKDMVREEVNWCQRVENVTMWDRREWTPIKGIPKLLDFDFQSENFMMSPFIALDFAKGQPLVWTDFKPARMEAREKVLKQVADITLGLLRVNELIKAFGAKQWMEDMIEAASEQVLSPSTSTSSFSSRSSTPMGMSPESTELARNATSCLQIIDATMDNAESIAEKQQELLTKYLLPDLESAPLVLCHGNIEAAKLIIDDEYNVSLIDFGFAHLAPLQFSAAYPRFLTHEPEPLPLSLALDKRTEKVGWALGWGKKDTPQMRKDRAMYLDFVQKAAKNEMTKWKKQKEREERFSTTKGAKMLEWPVPKLLEAYADVLSNKDEINRSWWLSSMTRVDVWAQMEACGWEPKKDVVSSIVGVKGAERDLEMR